MALSPKLPSQFETFKALVAAEANPQDAQALAKAQALQAAVFAVRNLRGMRWTVQALSRAATAALEERERWRIELAHAQRESETHDVVERLEDRLEAAERAYDALRQTRRDFVRILEAFEDAECIAQSKLEALS